MIFNEMNTNAVSYNNIEESPYDLGIGGALMHVLENEQNYNALMKAAALSEMKYYNENGGNLFVQEAGALSGFVEKVKAFFKKVIEKIKSIAKKFVAKINQFSMNDKDFVKKYQNDLIRRDLSGMEFNGYTFPLTKGNIKEITDASSGVDGNSTHDDLNDIIEKNRGNIVGGSAMTESEYRDELKEKLYGDKDDIKVNIRAEIDIISKTDALIKAAEKEEKNIINLFEKEIKEIDKLANNAITNSNKTYKKGENVEFDDFYIKGLNNLITVFKAYSNDLTVYFGGYVKALADRNRQAKAICVKALSYNKAKNESAVKGGYADIFTGVEIV